MADTSASMLYNGSDAPGVEKGQSHINVTQAKPENRNVSRYSADLAKRLGNLKYDGYMRIGDMKLAWLADGESRIAVGEGTVLDDGIRIGEVHENFILVSAAGQIARRIPFTQSPGRTSPAATRRSERKDDQDNNAIGTVIHIEPALKVVKSKGEKFTVQVKIDNGSNIFAVPFDIKYDPGILEVTGLYEGSYLKKDGGQTSFLTSMNRDKGKISVGLTRLGRIGGASGSGTLMSIGFSALKSGTTFLSFENGKPMDSRLNILPVRFARGRIEVQGGDSRIPPGL
jgi:hypothetical protein